MFKRGNRELVDICSYTGSREQFCSVIRSVNIDWQQKIRPGQLKGGQVVSFNVFVRAIKEGQNLL